jgi:hypothetical protein
MGAQVFLDHSLVCTAPGVMWRGCIFKAARLQATGMNVQLEL